MTYLEKMRNLPLEAIEAPVRKAVAEAIRSSHALGLATCHSGDGGIYYLYPNGLKRYQTEADYQRAVRYLCAARSSGDYFGLDRRAHPRLGRAYGHRIESLLKSPKVRAPEVFIRGQ